MAWSAKYGMARTSDTFSFWRPRKSLPLMINLHLSLSPSSLFLTCQWGTALSPRICSSPTEIITLHRIVLSWRHFSSSNELFEEKIRNDRTGMRCRLPPRPSSSSFHPNLHPGPSIHQIAFPPPPPPPPSSWSRSCNHFRLANSGTRYRRRRCSLEGT